MEFINLYVQTEYSLLNSTIRLKDLISKAVNDGSTSLAICDNNAMYGAIKFYSLCHDNNIKPIIGLRLSLASMYNYSNYILLYAMNNQGYINLMKLSTVSKTSNHVDMDILSKYNDGLICVIPGLENELIKIFKHERYDEFSILLSQYQRIYPNLFIGLSLQGVGKHYLVEKLMSCKKKYNLKLVGLHRANFLNDSDFEAYKLVKSVDMNNTVYNPTEEEFFYNYISNTEALREFNKYPELIENTKVISDLCNVSIEFGVHKLPKYDINIADSGKYLKDLCLYGLKRRLENKNCDHKQYINRLFNELEVISQTGFNDYFLIVYDFVKYAKKNNILVGPGRGSGPSSLVSYSLGITEVDPLEYALLFERFLNTQRITMPDIDTDFPDNRRDEVIKYVGQKYGVNKVAHISTFGTYGPKSAIRDIARIKNIPDLFVNEILKYIPNSKMSIEDCFKNEQFVRLIDGNSNLKEAVEIAKVLEGIPRNISTHAAGVVMTEEDLVNYTPLQKGMNGLYQTQYEAGDLEKLGLLKIDFLGIRNLSIINEVLNEIYINENKKIDISKIPLNDEKVFELIRSGDTDGIFQLESAGMRSVLVRLKTNSLQDIIYATSLFRPGPMEMIPTFIARKLGKEKVTYVHNDLKPILESTYGIIVFQEQIMLIAQKFAGYSLGEADILRRAVSKKKREVLERERERFVSSSIKQGYDSKTSNTIYDYIVKFANYGFNKSHAVVYSIISYQMAYLKVHYYKYFMANLMSNSLGSPSLVKTYINNCLKQNIEVVPPSINYSTKQCRVYNDKIYYPLIGISNIGGVIVNDLLKERETNGLYQDYFDFVSRTKKIINGRILASLVNGGALDEFGLTRKTMISQYNNVLLRSDYQMLKDEFTDFDFSSEEYSFDEMTSKEHEALGFNLKYNLLSKYDDYKHKMQLPNINNLSINKNYRLLGIIKRINEIQTKKGDLMAFLEIYDETGELDVVVFPQIYGKYKQSFQTKSVYLFEGMVEVRNDKKQLVLENVFKAKQN